MKMEDNDLHMVRCFWGNNSFTHEVSPSRGALGRIIVIRDLDHISHKRMHILDYFIVIKAVWMTSG